MTAKFFVTHFSAHKKNLIQSLSLGKGSCIRTGLKKTFLHKVHVSGEGFAHAFEWHLSKLIPDDAQHWNWKLLGLSCAVGKILQVSAGVSLSALTLELAKSSFSSLTGNWYSRRNGHGEM